MRTKRHQNSQIFQFLIFFNQRFCEKCLKIPQIKPKTQKRSIYDQFHQLIAISVQFPNFQGVKLP